MTNRKTSKRRHMTVVQSEKGEPTIGTQSNIYTIHQHFTLRFKHLRGSNRPAGYFHDGFASRDGSLNVRWLWTKENGFFAPELSFRPTALGTKVAVKVAKTLGGFAYDAESPLNLILKLRATNVCYVQDNKEGCWDDYMPIDLPVEDEDVNAMVVLAKAAQ
jgi:hypothetical protein